ncbi:MAG: carbohydrate kinase [Bacteroidetes bacterium]|nr:MAG: carbohydrate kinase [Bacteroidota bacterium]
MKESVIAIFDIGKTNKKLLLFNYDLRVITESEEKFTEIRDEDGFECDDTDLIELWIRESLKRLIHSDEYNLTAVNFTTYGATLVYLDSNGRRLTPVYNYLKPIDQGISENLYNKYDGREEFCRRTASPSLGMLNSGIQPLWLKSIRPELFGKVKHILHFPQYLSYILTGKIYAEHTSIGCHTALWDFDKMNYHQWVNDECLAVPQPVSAGTFNEIEIYGKKIKVGIGLHDSSAALVPYLTSDDRKFILVSTGTWCINMNPFNSEKLTAEQLSKDCLCYMSINMQPVKSSRLFLGHLHGTALCEMSNYFKIQEDSFKLIKPDMKMFNKVSAKFRTRKVFFIKKGLSWKLKEEPDLFEFDNFVEAYHQLLIELCDLTVEAIDLVMCENDEIKTIYITGGFSKNDIFIKLLTSSYPHMQVFTSEISNASALGAALVISGLKLSLNLGLTECKI